jgi:ribosomal-protein-alanine N-acetyltransferase
MGKPFPRVETDRLLLRRLKIEDAAETSRMMTPDVAKWLAAWPVPFTVAMSEERIANAHRIGDNNSALVLAIESRASGLLLGWTGIHRTDDDPRRGTFGYWIGEEHQGKGYMREAAPAALRMAFDWLALDVIQAAAQPDNRPSIAVLEGCGMGFVGERPVFAPARNQDEVCAIYELIRAG